jgi:hypothetical protein
MPEPMKPTDVPDELARTAAELLRENGLWGAWEPEQTEEEVRGILAAVLPLHEQRVRQAIAAELAKLTIPCGTHRDRSAFDTRCASCQRYTALIGAGRLVLGQDGA